MLAHLVAHCLFAAVTGGKWEKFGGSQREDGSIESRTLTVEWDEGEGGRYARFPYRLTIANGPGRKTQTGAVSPAGEPTARLSMRMPEADMIKVMLALGAYMQAYEAAHHRRIVADRMRELNSKLAERAAVHIQPTDSKPRVAPIAANTANAAQPRQAAAPATAIATRQTVRPMLTAIPGGNSEINKIEQPRTLRAG